MWEPHLGHFLRLSKPQKGNHPGAPSMLRPGARQEDARKKFAVFVLVEPGALDVKEPDAGEGGEGERIVCQLSDGLFVRASGL
jgi:hypothetical protein